MRPSATFRVVAPVTGEVVNTYQMPYDDAKDLQALYSDARRVWGEYFVEAETDLFVMSNSHTYRQELEMEELALTTAWMNGEID